MKTKLKFSLIHKNISYFLMLVLVLLCTACGDNDEPNKEYPNSEDSGAINPSILTGTWLIESINVNGLIHDINKTITILPFNVDYDKSDPDQTPTVMKYITFWSCEYKNIGLVSTIEGNKTFNMTILYAKKSGEDYKNGLIHGFSCLFDDQDLNGYTTIGVDYLDYSNGVLTATGGAYSYSPSDGDDIYFSGILVMRKI